jgi:uncharacterized protein (UPF0147 family)
MNPITLQAIQLMTGIISSEKVPEEIKKSALNVLSNLFVVLEHETLDMKLTYSKIQL